MRVVIPAYILSELKAGFQIGTVLFFPFLVIDLVVASITTSVGMMQLPPVVISTPLKILLFVMVDGWNLVVGSLMRVFIRAGIGRKPGHLASDFRHGPGANRRYLCSHRETLVGLASAGRNRGHG